MSQCIHGDYDCLYVSVSKLSTWQNQSHISVTPTVVLWVHLCHSAKFNTFPSLLTTAEKIPTVLSCLK